MYGDNEDISSTESDQDVETVKTTSAAAADAKQQQVLNPFKGEIGNNDRAGEKVGLREQVTLRSWVQIQFPFNKIYGRSLWTT